MSGVSVAFLVLVVTILAIWLIAHRRAQRKLRALLQITQRLAAGDLSARTGFGEAGGELGRLARAFDDMAAALQHHDLALLRSEADQHFLADAAQQLTSSLDYERTLRTFTELIVSHIADWCVLRLRAEGAADQPVVLVQHAEPAMRELANRLAERYRAQPGDPVQPMRQVMATGESKFIRKVRRELLLESADEDDHRLLDELGFRSAMIVPVRAGAVSIGVVMMMFTEDGRAFDHDTLRLAEELARRAAHALENARLYSEARKERS